MTSVGSLFRQDGQCLCFLQGREANCLPPLILCFNALASMLFVYDFSIVTNDGGFGFQRCLKRAFCDFRVDCLEEEFLFGSLTITIRNLEGFKQPMSKLCF